MRIRHLSLFTHLIIMVASLSCFQTAKAVGGSITNPDPSYWFPRADGPTTHQYNTDGQYLILTIPQGSTQAYFNSEVYNSPFSTLQPRNVILNPYIIDNPYTQPDNYITDIFLNIPYQYADFSSTVRVDNLKAGSRGWGFWNTIAPLNGIQTAWFIQLDGLTPDGNPYFLNGFWAITQVGIFVSVKKLPDLDENWHDYRINWTSSSVDFWIDNTLVHSEKQVIPSGYMAFHNWVDNAVFEFDKLGFAQHVLQNTSGPRSNHIQNMTIIW